LDPQQKAVAEEFDQYAVSYDGVVNEALGFTRLKVDAFVEAKAEHILRSLQGHFGRSQELAVLDLGCGIGNYHDYFRGRFRRLVGADVSQSCVDQARRLRPDVEYIAYDGVTLPLEAGSFDMVYAICVLHHVPRATWSGFISEMRRMLRPGGLALIYEHNPYNPLTMKVVNSCPFDADAVLVKPAIARTLLKDAGFAQVTTRSILTFPPLKLPVIATALERADRLVGRLPFGTQYCARGTVE